LTKFCKQSDLVEHVEDQHNHPHTHTLLPHHSVFSQYHFVIFARSAERDRVNTWKPDRREDVSYGGLWSSTLVGIERCGERREPQTANQDVTVPLARRWCSLFTNEHRPGLHEDLAERVFGWKFDHKREL